MCERPMVQLPVDQTFQETLRNEVLPIAAPEFQKSTEDGTVCPDILGLRKGKWIRNR